MTSTAEIGLLVAGIAGLIWISWVYVREAQRCYAADMEAQRRSREQQQKDGPVPRKPLNSR